MADYMPLARGWTPEELARCCISYDGAGIEKRLDELKKSLYKVSSQPNTAQKEGGTMMNQMKQYFEKHKDAIITVAIVILVDHFVFGGAMREKIRRVVEGMLNSAERKMIEGAKE